MEQKLKIQVPDGCSAKIEQQDGFLVVVFEPKKWEPKDGDIYALPSGGIGIYNSHYELRHGTIPCYCCLCADGTLVIIKPDESRGFGKFCEELRPATDDEKQRLFDALAKEKKRWNPKTKQIEDLPRWRAVHSESYYVIGSELNIDCQSEIGHVVDDNRYKAGNYFRTHEAASRAAEKIRKILKESEAE